MIRLQFTNEDFKNDFLTTYTPVAVEFEGHPETMDEYVKMVRGFAFNLGFSEELINEYIVDPYGISYIENGE